LQLGDLYVLRSFTFGRVHVEAAVTVAGFAGAGSELLEAGPDGLADFCVRPGSSAVSSFRPE